MQTVWFPVPVAALFRRIVNVVSTLSISHHYLHQPPAAADPPRTHAFQALRWPAWLRVSQTPWNLSLADGSGASTNPQGDDDLQEPPRRTMSPSRPRRNDQIHQLISHPTLYDPVRKPRYPIVLCHGLYGFDVRGPSAFPILQQHYWSNVLNVLRGKVGAEVLVTGVPSTGSISSRAENLDRFLRDKAPGRGINFLAHSMGGLDCRHLISHIKPTDYTPLSLTTIATPHRGSPFMDWCRQYIGLGRYKAEHPEQLIVGDETDRTSASQESASPSSKQVAGVKSLLSLASLPSSFTTLLLSLLDSPAYANLTSTYLNTIFNPATPNDPSVKYFSVAGRISSMSIWHPLWLPKMVLDGFEEKERARMRETGHPIADMDSEWGNDGLVTVQSARWGEFLGVLEGCDHWDLRGARGLDVDLPSIPGPDGWNIADWGKFVRAWKREEKEAARSAGAKLSEQKHEESLAAASVAQSEQPGGTRDTRTPRERERDSANADEVVKSSTDKLSAVFDWIVEQVPAPRSLAPLSAISGGSGSRANQSSEDLPKMQVRERDRRTKQAEKSDLETKRDLERFYVALCRKLYDEGL